MPKIYLCFLWHMHQPFYKDLVSGEYRLPWTRMHALKDYYGMVKILEEFPQIHQTFNLVPSMIVQVEEYARGEAKDPFLALALKSAELLTLEEQAFILRNFFMANPSRMIYRYTRFGELYTAWLAQKGIAETRGIFSPQELRDLQVLSQVAWFDEFYLENDPEVRALVAKGRIFTHEDQALMGRKQQEICAQVIPQYRKLAMSGQIEISTTPFYHPILPLLCDSDIASAAHPYVHLPPRFCYPQDAIMQLERASDYFTKIFGVAPAGLWPSEGSVSDHALDLAATVGFRWAASDNGVLERTLRRPATPEVSYRPFEWRQGGKKIGMIFRDHLLSDLIGFVYSNVAAADAATDFLRRIGDNCAPILNAGRDALVPIILDGENAWEYYDRNGRPFFRELYGRIQADPRMEALTVTEAFGRMTPEPLGNIFPGSWINANFDVWIGAEEDNKAWRLLLDARRAYDHAAANSNVSDARRSLAMEEILIAEGSDWNWWYGPEHETANAVEFDRIYREHLANVYHALDLPAPPELSIPIIRIKTEEHITPPRAPISPAINGVVDSYFEWLGAGIYRVDRRSGSMHGKQMIVKELRYGSNDSTIFLRVDFDADPGSLSNLNVVAEIDGVEGKLNVFIDGTGARVTTGQGSAAFRDVLEISLPAPPSEPKVRLSFWQDGLPIQAIPPQDFLPVPSSAVWSG